MGGHQSVSQEEKEELFRRITSNIQEHLDQLTHGFYSLFHEQYINVGIDDSILKYSGRGSTAVLDTYSSELQAQVPGYIESAGSALAGFAAVPHAVGVGALVISMILQLAFITTKGTADDPADIILRRIFAEEKASEVRDMMAEYLKRYMMHLRAQNLLVEDSRFLERSLSERLTRLKNSMLIDGEMTSRSLKHWANGAAFHAQVLLHLARLQRENPSSFETAKSAARSAIGTYKHDMTELLKKYKEYKTSKFILYNSYAHCILPMSELCHSTNCYFNDVDVTGEYYLSSDICQLPAQHYIDYFFKNHPHIASLQSYFSDLEKNFPALCNEVGTFQIKT